MRLAEKILRWIIASVGERVGKQKLLSAGKVSGGYSYTGNQQCHFYVDNVEKLSPVHKETQSKMFIDFLMVEIYWKPKWSSVGGIDKLWHICSWRIL